MESREKLYGEEIPAEVYDLAALLINFVHELDERYADGERRQTDE